MADMDTLADIASFMVPDLPGCESGVIVRYLRRATNRFLQDTEVWERDVTVDLIEDQALYNIALADSMVRRIKRVRYIDPDTDVAKNEFAGREINLGYVRLNRDPDSLYIMPQKVPTEAEEGYQAIVKVVDVPDITSDILDAEMITRWSEGFRYRAMYELTLLKDRPWSDVDLANRYLADYLAEVNRARFESLHLDRSVSLRMQAPSFT